MVNNLCIYVIRWPKVCNIGCICIKKWAPNKNINFTRHPCQDFPRLLHSNFFFKVFGLKKLGMYFIFFILSKHRNNRTPNKLSLIVKHSHKGPNILRNYSTFTNIKTSFKKFKRSSLESEIIVNIFQKIYYIAVILFVIIKINCFFLIIKCLNDFLFYCVFYKANCHIRYNLTVYITIHWCLYKAYFYLFYVRLFVFLDCII